MKLNDQGSGLKSNAKQSASLEFGIGDESVVIEILRNRLYGNPIQTLVQEYICNARDASREYGTARPIEIQIPKKEEPTFKVRDFGPGITPDRMAKVFVLFGSSTKRDSDVQTGGFGIGAKSAWAYSDSFSIITFVDGIRRSYLAHIGENRKGKLDLLTEDKTTEPNGTEIRIAVQDKHFQNFEDAVFRAVYLWKDEPKITGFQLEIPAYFQTRKEAVVYKTKTCEFIKGRVPNFIVVKDLFNGGGSLTFSIDGIPYRVEQWAKALQEFKDLSDMVNHGHSLVLFFNTGDLEVSATRESIVETTFNEKQIRAASKAAKLEIESKIQADLMDVKTVPELIATYKKSLAIYGKFIPAFAVTGRHGVYRLGAHAESLNYSKFAGLKITEVYFKHNGTINENPLSFFIGNSSVTEIYYDDNTKGKDESKNLTRRRLKKYINKVQNENLDIANAYIIKQGTLSKNEFESVAKEMGAIPLSNLNYDKASTQHIVKKAEDKFFTYTYSAYSVGNGYGGSLSRSSNTTDPADTMPMKKYVYFTHDSYLVSHGWSEQQFIGFVYLLNRNMIGVASVVESSVRKAKKHPQFISIKDFLENMDHALVKAESLSFRVSAAAAEHNLALGSSTINRMHQLLDYYEPGMVKSQKMAESLTVLKQLSVILDATKAKDAILQLPLDVVLAGKQVGGIIEKEIDALQYFVLEYNTSFLLLKHMNYMKEDPALMAELIRYLNTRD